MKSFCSVLQVLKSFLEFDKALQRTQQALAAGPTGTIPPQRPSMYSPPGSGSRSPASFPAFAASQQSSEAGEFLVDDSDDASSTSYAAGASTSGERAAWFVCVLCARLQRHGRTRLTRLIRVGRVRALPFSCVCSFRMSMQPAPPAEVR